MSAKKKSWPETVTADRSLDCWYDRHTRCWVVQILDPTNDNWQIGGADYCPTPEWRDAAIDAARKRILAGTAGRE